jgi:hypothetical protein
MESVVPLAVRNRQHSYDRKSPTWRARSVLHCAGRSNRRPSCAAKRIMARKTINSTVHMSKCWVHSCPLGSMSHRSGGHLGHKANGRLPRGWAGQTCSSARIHHARADVVVPTTTNNSTNAPLNKGCSPHTQLPLPQPLRRGAGNGTNSKAPPPVYRHCLQGKRNEASGVASPVRRRRHRGGAVVGATAAASLPAAVSVYVYVVVAREPAPANPHGPGRLQAPEESSEPATSQFGPPVRGVGRRAAGGLVLFPVPVHVRGVPRQLELEQFRRRGVVVVVVVVVVLTAAAVPRADRIPVISLW